MQAFMWYIDQQCYFSIGQPGPTDQGDGTCTLQGHRTVRFYEQGEAQEHEVDEIDWLMTGTAHTDKFIYQLGEWGPIAEMTDMRYKEEDSAYFLWQKTDGHCEVCTDFGDWFPTIVGAEVVVPAVEPSPVVAAANATARVEQSEYYV